MQHLLRTASQSCPSREFRDAGKRAPNAHIVRLDGYNTLD
jgi:hypothetical protein